MKDKCKINRKRSNQYFMVIRFKCFNAEYNYDIVTNHNNDNKC